jgi:hypothetical protein
MLSARRDSLTSHRPSRSRRCSLSLPSSPHQVSTAEAAVRPTRPAPRTRGAIARDMRQFRPVLYVTALHRRYRPSPSGTIGTHWTPKSIGHRGSADRGEASLAQAARGAPRGSSRSLEQRARSTRCEACGQCRGQFRTVSSGLEPHGRRGRQPLVGSRGRGTPTGTTGRSAECPSDACPRAIPLVSVMCVD